MEREEKNGLSSKHFVAHLRMNELMGYSQETLVKAVMELESELRKLDKKNRQLEYQVEQLQKKIADIERAKQPLSKYAGYNKKGTTLEKIFFILSRNEKPLRTEEIKQALLLMEPELKERWTNPSNHISQILYLACKRQAITRTKQFGTLGQYCYQIQTITGKAI